MSLPAARVFNSHAVASGRTATPPPAMLSSPRHPGPGSGKILEHLHYVEGKHALDVRNFHLMQRFHAKAASSNTARLANRA
jgi:hypothetical protein